MYCYGLFHHRNTYYTFLQDSMFFLRLAAVITKHAVRNTSASCSVISLFLRAIPQIVLSLQCGSVNLHFSFKARCLQTLQCNIPQKRRKRTHTASCAWIVVCTSAHWTRRYQFLLASNVVQGEFLAVFEQGLRSLSLVMRWDQPGCTVHPSLRPHLHITLRDPFFIFFQARFG